MLLSRIFLLGFCLIVLLVLLVCVWVLTRSLRLSLCVGACVFHRVFTVVSCIFISFSEQVLLGVMPSCADLLCILMLYLARV